MKLTNWMRASFYLSLFTCIVAVGGIIVLFGRLEILRSNLATAQGGLLARLDRLSDEVSFSSPADSGHKHMAVRGLIIQSQLAQVTSPVVFVGDSITESAFLPAVLCGHPVLNAGLGGASARSYLHFANSVLPTLKAALIVVAIGTNDSQIAARKGVPFAESYSTLIDFLKPHAPAIVFVGVPPLEMNQTLASAYFDQDASKENDRIIRAVAAQNSIPFADVRSTMTGENLTIDGVHLTPDGYEKWMAAVLPAVTKAISCQARSN